MLGHIYQATLAMGPENPKLSHSLDEIHYYYVLTNRVWIFQPGKSKSICIQMRVPKEVHARDMRLPRSASRLDVQLNIILKASTTHPIGWLTRKRQS